MENDLNAGVAARRSRVAEGRRSPGFVLDLLSGFLAMILAVPLAFAIFQIYNNIQGDQQREVLVLAVFSAMVVALPAAGYSLALGRRVDPRWLGAVLLASVAIVLVSIYLFHVSFAVLFPGDILIWSESDFVNDILKFRAGYPLYTAQVNNDSFVYPPGTQLLTYFLAWAVGNPVSIPVYRAIQVGYTLLAAALALYCSWQIRQLAGSDGHPSHPIWGILGLPLLFLIASNPLTNAYTHNLHNDALAQLVSISAYALLLVYTRTHDWRVLGWMALIPAAGFLVKQNLIVWGAFYGLHLLFFDRPRSFRRLGAFAVTSAALLGAAMGMGVLLWGEHFFYWVFYVLGKHSVMPLLSFQHLLDVWPYLAIGLVGGYTLLRARNFSHLFGPWLIWLLLILMQIYTSGVAWMLNHIGPGSLLAGVWLLAALPRLWPLPNFKIPQPQRSETWLRATIGTAALGLLFSGLGIVRIPLPSVPDGAQRYIQQIEAEFTGLPADRVLLDAGTWVYLPAQVVMKDRAPTIGERGWSQTGDFSGILGRIEDQHYRKILVRNLHAEQFWYDFGLWDRSSGIRQALLDNYVEVGRIPSVKDAEWYLYAEVSILTPKPR